MTSQPRTCSPRAASRPSSPPPITTALQPRPRFLEQRARVVQRAEHVHVLLVDAGNRRNERAAARGENQLVVIGVACRLRRSRRRLSRSMSDDPHAEPRANVVALVPLESLRTISSADFSPASTNDSRMRL